MAPRPSVLLLDPPLLRRHVLSPSSPPTRWGDLPKARHYGAAPAPCPTRRARRGRSPTPQQLTAVEVAVRTDAVRTDCCGKKEQRFAAAALLQPRFTPTRSGLRGLLQRAAPAFFAAAPSLLRSAAVALRCAATHRFSPAFRCRVDNRGPPARSAVTVIRLAGVLGKTCLVG